MNERPKFFDDLAGVAGGAISALAGLREELSALTRARVEETLRRLDLVQREEFEAMAELARHAREDCEALAARVAKLEAASSAAVEPAPEPSVSGTLAAENKAPPAGEAG